MPIEKGFLNEAAEVRFWRLPNIAMVPCGGTHVHSTGEIGAIDLKRDRANKGVERIRITLKDSQPTSSPNLQEVSAISFTKLQKGTPTYKVDRGASLVN